MLPLLPLLPLLPWILLLLRACTCMSLLHATETSVETGTAGALSQPLARQYSGAAGYTNVIAPDGKCCWDIYSDNFAARNYTITGPSGTNGPWDYSGQWYERADFCDREGAAFWPAATDPRPPIPPVMPKPPEAPAAPPLPPNAPQLKSPPSSMPLPPSPIMYNNCSLAIKEVSFAIPSISRGPFYIAISVLHGGSAYCKLCGCRVSYIILERGASTLYTSSSSPSAPESAKGGYVSGDDGSGTMDGPSPAAQPKLPSIDDLFQLGMNPTGIALPGGLREMNITTVPTSSMPGQQTNESSGGGDSSSNNTDPGHSNNTGVTVTPGESPAAAWMVQPERSGDYLFRMEVGTNLWWRWVVVDIDPPRLSGQLSVSKATVTFGSQALAAQSGVGNAASVRYLLVLLNMSEPVHKFDTATALQLSDSVSVLRAECFEDIETAAKIAGDAPTTVAATVTAPNPPGPPPTPAASSAISKLLQLGDGVMKYAVASGVPFVRSCLVVLYTPEGSRASVTLPEGAVRDFTGNLNSRPLLLEAQLPGAVMQSSSSSADAASTLGPAGTFISGFLSTTTAAAASASSLSILTSRLSMLQNAYHFQLLAMTASLASPGVSHRYRLVAGNLRWSVMSIQGNIPILDTAFGKPMEVKVADQLPTPALRPAGAPTARALLSTLNDDSYASSFRSSRYRRDRSLAAAVVNPIPQQTQPSLSPSAPPTGLNIGSSQPAHASSNSSAASGETANTYKKQQDSLIAWLWSMSQFSSGDNNNSSSYNSSTNNDTVVNNYVIGGAASGNGSVDVLAVDPSGRVLSKNGSHNYRSSNLPPPPATGTPPNNSTAKPTLRVNTQDLIYTLGTAVVLLAAVMLGHALVALLCRLYLGPDLPAVLQFPRMEVALASVIPGFDPLHYLSLRTRRGVKNVLKSFLAQPN
ncbi:hypothetical protein VOLCADRAFT_95847 [Volvox carteri f. nagariensis]|uniref:Uncharacterized protein n=1 Tax=Volvox carteri f. nagariensis TaxID=3068 RepID=D8U8J1_VOLCA|nr:uncharacterized protein VOLCADRAFT_95847 [Volvox carteri f. nagariensis]EFJ43932.1 hypothetical protein VOLCADRAFT_95847 [Volvox carteri f. nagariensis]|eukprot:XP_002954944.1 hypothetical protein VOLCADRAFT_95847 [Volvox carteri f. nagariensis]